MTPTVLSLSPVCETDSGAAQAPAHLPLGPGEVMRPVPQAARKSLPADLDGLAREAAAAMGQLLVCVGHATLPPPSVASAYRTLAVFRKATQALPSALHRRVVEQVMDLMRDRHARQARACPRRASLPVLQPLRSAAPGRGAPATPPRSRRCASAPGGAAA